MPCRVQSMTLSRVWVVGCAGFRGGNTQQQQSVIQQAAQAQAQAAAAGMDQTLPAKPTLNRQGEPDVAQTGRIVCDTVRVNTRFVLSCTCVRADAFVP